MPFSFDRFLTNMMHRLKMIDKNTYLAPDVVVHHIAPRRQIMDVSGRNEEFELITDQTWDGASEVYIL